MSNFELTMDSAYLLGTALSDLRLAKRKYQRVATLQTIDKDFVEAVEAASFAMIGRHYVVARSPAKTTRQTWRVQITNTILHDWLFDQTHDGARVPLALRRADRDIQRHFLAGVMDGDGWVSINKKYDKPHRSISSFALIGAATTKPWIDDVKVLADVMQLPTHGPSLMKRSNPNFKPIYHLRFKAKEFVRAEIPLRIERKAARLRRLLFLLESSEAIRSEP